MGQGQPINEEVVLRNLNKKSKYKKYIIFLINNHSNNR